MNINQMARDLLDDDEKNTIQDNDADLEKWGIVIDW